MTLHVEVTQEHINKGKQLDCRECPVALALMETGCEDVRVFVTYSNIRLEGKTYNGKNPQAVMDLIVRHDCPVVGKAEPISFDLELEAA